MISDKIVKQIRIVQKIRQTSKLIGQATGVSTVCVDQYGELYPSAKKYTLSDDRLKELSLRVIGIDGEKIFRYFVGEREHFIISKLFFLDEVVGSVIVGPFENNHEFSYYENQKRIIHGLSKISSITGLETENINKDNNNILYDIVSGHDNYDFVYIMQGLLKAFRTRDKGRINVLTKEFFNKLIKKSEDTSIEFIKYFMVLYYGFFVIILLDNGYDVNFTSVTVQRFMKRMFNINSEEKLVQYVKEQIGEFYKIYSNDESNVKYSKNVKEVIVLMQQNIGEQITIEEVSKKFSISKRHLSRIIKTETGKTYTELYNDLKIEHAKVLLRHTRFNMVEIASSIGINSQSYFSAMFKKSTEMTPSNYRIKSKNI